MNRSAVRRASVCALMVVIAGCSSGTGAGGSGGGGGRGGGPPGGGAGGSGGHAGASGSGGGGFAGGALGGGGIAGTAGGGAGAGAGGAGGGAGIGGGGAAGAQAAGGEAGTHGAGGAAGNAGGAAGSIAAGGAAGAAANAGASGTGVAGAAGNGSGAAGASGGGGGTAGRTGGAGAGGAAGGGACDSVCETGEVCSPQGICRGPISRWPTLGGDVHHSGFNANETGTPPLSPAWTAPLAVNASLASTGGLWPAISDGTRLYVAENGYFDSATSMWALDPATGHTLWTYNFGRVSDLSQATVDRGYVYVAQVNNTPGTYMYSFVAATGKPLWSLPFSDQWDHIWAPLVTPAGYLYFEGGEYGGLFGLRASDGTQIFFNGGLAQWDSWSPTFLGGQIYTYVDGYLMTNDLLTNAVLQTVSVQVPYKGTAYSMNAAPVSDGLKIYLVAPPSLVAYLPGKTTPEWTASGAYAGMPAVANGVVYAISGGQLRANDAATGSILWTFAADSALTFPPVVAGRFVYAASSKNVYAFDTAAQQMVWSTTPGGWLSIAGGKVYVAQANGTLAAYALTPGTP